MPSKGQKMENLNFSLSLTVSEWNAILKGLSELPFKEAVEIINKIRTAGEAAIKAEAERTSPLVEQTAEAA